MVPLAKVGQPSGKIRVVFEDCPLPRLTQVVKQFHHLTLASLEVPMGRLGLLGLELEVGVAARRRTPDGGMLR
jgi:hypothetical protein